MTIDSDQPVGPTTPLNLETFFQRVRSVNPFLHNRVNGLAPDYVDVEEVHAAAFDRLTALAGEACGEQRGLGALLLGEAGVGKSHLLARLNRWADRDDRACFVNLHNLQASPEFLPHSLLRAVVSYLTQGRAGDFRGTYLFRLVASFAHEAFQYRPDCRPGWAQIHRAYERLVDSLSAGDPSRAALTDRRVYDVLFHFFRSAYEEYHAAQAGQRSPGNNTAALAVRWLSGDSLDPDEARLLGLPAKPDRDAPTGLRDGQEIKQVLVALSRLAQARRQPFILCFDQADNLDAEQMAALARFLEALIDSAPNLLVITAGIDATLRRWHEDKVIQDSAWDRLAQFEESLVRIRPAEAEHIVAERLAHFLAPFRDLPKIRQYLEEDDFFPLGRSLLAEILRGRGDLRPRDVITWVREGWRRQQEQLTQRGGADWLAEWRPFAVLGEKPELELTADQFHEVLDRKVAQEVANHITQCQARPATLPPDPDRMAGLVAHLLEQCQKADRSYGIAGVEKPPTAPSADQPYHLVLRRVLNGYAKSVGLRFLVTDSATSATAALRQLVNVSQPLERVFLVTDARMPLRTGSRGDDYLDDLKNSKVVSFRVIELAFDEYATLDALQAVVAQARSGELELELPGRPGRPISVEDVIASHHRQGRYRSAPLLQELLAEGARTGDGRARMLT